MQLSKNFRLKEFTKSRAAARRGINNSPGIRETDNLRLLVSNVLQPLRDQLGVPLKVTSGYRSVDVNRAIGGSQSSDHCFGRAADFETMPETRALMYEAAKYIQDNLEFKQLIWEFDGAWIHVSYEEGRNRKEVLEAYRGASGRTQYRPYKF